MTAEPRSAGTAAGVGSDVLARCRNVTAARSPSSAVPAGVRIDVVLHDLDAVEHRLAEATRSRYDVDGLPGYLAGIPTYTLAAELAVTRVLVGTLPSPVAFPRLLAAAGDEGWGFRAWFSLEHARMRARRGDVTVTLGHLGRAAVEASLPPLLADATAGVDGRMRGPRRSSVSWDVPSGQPSDGFIPNRNRVSRVRRTATS